MTWQTINQATQGEGAPDIDYERFASRFDQDPVLQQLVARFDGRGVVLKTDEKEPPAQGQQAQGQDPHAGINQMAKSATNRAFG